MATIASSTYPRPNTGAHGCMTTAFPERITNSSACDSTGWRWPPRIASHQIQVATPPTAPVIATSVPSGARRSGSPARQAPASIPAAIARHGIA